MDIKLMDNMHRPWLKWTWLKWISLVVIMLGMCAIIPVGANYENCILAVNGDNYLYQRQYNRFCELENIVVRLHSDEMTAEERSGLEQQRDEIVYSGYRYFVFDKNGRPIDTDNIADQIAMEQIYMRYPYSFTSYHDDLYISVALTDDGVQALRREMEPQRQSGMISLVCAAVGVLLVITGCVLRCLSGALGVGKRRIYNDILFLLCALTQAGGITGVAGLFLLSHDSYISNGLAVGLSVLCGVICAFVLWATAGGFAACVKEKRFWRNTLAWQCLRLAGRCIAAAARFIGRMFRPGRPGHISRCFFALGFIYLLFLMCFVLLIGRTTVFEVYLIFAVPVLITLTALMIRYARQYKGVGVIRSATAAMRAGSTGVVIPDCGLKELNDIAGDINSLGQGFDAAVQEAVKASRMKTELITNVSHDLKTPLTSIISYVDLLEREELQGQAKQYVDVLKLKSERLKDIITDLFELAKGESSTAEVSLERLDFAMLVKQLLSENKDVIDASGFEIKSTVPHSVFVLSDGKRLSRIIQNLLDNALKYSLAGTRIYLRMETSGTDVRLTLLNTAGYEMTFTREEIMQRFARGDKSRTGEGSGLGLAIADTFAKLCGGSFAVFIDGDQFRAGLTLPVCAPPEDITDILEGQIIE